MKKKASDGWIAIAVIICSIVLFVALGLGLRGTVMIRNPNLVHVKFHDVTGIKVSSLVKYAGAPAGAVSGVRMLNATERSGDANNLVEITLQLTQDVPPLTQNAKVSIAADTLLSDKFVVIHDDPGSAPLLAQGEILQGISPTTFDKLIRNVDDALVGIRKTLGGETIGNAQDLFSKLNQIVEETQGLLVDLKPVAKDAAAVIVDAKVAVADTRSLIADNRQRIDQTIVRLNSASTSLESLAKRSDGLVRDNEKTINSTLAGLRVTTDNLKITTTYSSIFLRDITERPSRLIWGRGTPPTLPSEQDILKSRQTVLDR